MKELIGVFAPSGYESEMRELLTKRLKDKFDEVFTDNMGNLVAKNGDGGLCIECGMDTAGVMVVSVSENRAKFANVGKLVVKNVLGRNIVFGNGACGKICCDESVDADEAKTSDLYIELEKGEVKIGDFGAVDAEFTEDNFGYDGYGLSERVGVAVVCKALENIVKPENVTILFSSQKRLGARGTRGFFGANTFEKIITIDAGEEDGCTIVAKDEKMLAEPVLRKELESIAKKSDLDVHTVVTDENFFMEQIYVSCGDPCGAIGIGVIREEGEADRVNKADFDTAVSFIEEILKRG